jgi:hypothetical protein
MNCGGTGNVFTPPATTSTAQGGASSGTADGGSVTSFVTSGPGGSGGKEPCVADPYEATVKVKPVDIIVAIDNSGSMGGEIEEVEEQFNLNFAAILDAAIPAIDYHVIMVSEYGPFDGPESVCICEPLGGKKDMDMDGHCDQPTGQPAETAKFSHHSVVVSSHNALCRLLEGYGSTDEFGLHPNGYKDVLRSEAFKFFLVITDDGVTCSTQINGTPYSFSDSNKVAQAQQVATDWDAAVRALDPIHFGSDEMNRNYTFWSIISQAGYMKASPSDYGVPIPSSEAITTAECTPNSNGGVPADPGTGYQALSILTDGYRYPTCALEYSDIFKLMAEGVIEGAVAPCEFAMPEPPQGETLDPETIEVIYTPGGGGTPISFQQVVDPANCDFKSFYIDGDVITLCPEACTTVQADPMAKVELLAGCGTPIE